MRWHSAVPRLIILAVNNKHASFWKKTMFVLAVKATFVLRSEALRSGYVALECEHTYSRRQRGFAALEFFITGSKLPILWPRQIWSISQNCGKWLFQKTTFAPSAPCTIHFECMESGPDDSTRVRRLTAIDLLRRASVKIFMLAYGSFWLQLSRFSSNDWAPRNQNCKIDMELQIKTFKISFQT